MSIEEQKKEHKFMFQFIKAQDGTRSEPFVGNWESVLEILDLRKEGESPQNEDYILLVAVLNKEETKIPATPLITVQSFLDYNNQPAKEA